MDINFVDMFKQIDDILERAADAAPSGSRPAPCQVDDADVVQLSANLGIPDLDDGEGNAAILSHADEAMNLPAHEELRRQIAVAPKNHR